MSRLLFTLLATALAAAPASAQAMPETLDCSFTVGTSRSDANRSPQRADGDVDLRFTAIDLANGTAQLSEGAASRRVAAMASGHVVTFVDVMPSGNVAMTTVSALPSDGRRLAVTSSHVFGSVSPSYVAEQHYGSCVEG